MLFKTPKTRNHVKKIMIYTVLVLFAIGIASCEIIFECDLAKYIFTTEILNSENPNN